MQSLLRRQAVILQHPRAEVAFDPPVTAESIAAAKAAQERERLDAGICVECGIPLERHLDSSGCFLIGCPNRRME